jgi:2-polyprenyl-3-methyl-5-hydroxy-6-metoxy-1,4-benzoquinol methylase/glycosyltransferase involved in cell wall biosynthesis
MIILEHSRFDETSIAQNLGEPEYSYWFVRNAFRPVLERLGRVVSIADPHADADAIYRQAVRDGEGCVLLSYNPPHYLPVGIACPTIPVFAWEFDTIPDESWDANPDHDWRLPLARARRAVTHSSASVAAVRRAMGADYPVWSIPAPMFDRATAHRGSASGRVRVSIPLDGALAIDIARIDIQLFKITRRAEGSRALRLLDYAAKEGPRRVRQLDVDGVVYTAVFNPVDGRKNWVDIISAFLVAFAGTPDATLILKLTHSDLITGAQPVLEHIAKFGRFACRIVLLHGMLSDEGYARLLDASSFAVNASQGEGQCLPLMEFMSAGRPAIAPAHSAMLDYIAPDNAFIVATDIAPGHWPHDERLATRCYKHIVRSDDLARQYRASYRLACDDPDGYRAMSNAAIAAQQAYCSERVVGKRLKELLAPELAMASVTTIPFDPIDPPLDGLPIGDREDPYNTGVLDARRSGWYNEDDNELTPGFPLSRDNIVVDVGCGDGGPVSFAARLGAHVVLCDIDAERVEQTAQTLRATTPATVEFHVSNSAPLPLPDDYADRIICMEVLEHVDDPRVVMAELVRIGQPGALYLITVPGAASEHIQRAVAPDFYFEKPNHIRIFEPGKLKALVESAGLEPLVVDGYGFFWSFLMAIFWQTEAPLGQSHRAFETFASVWQQVLAGKDGARIKRAFDDVMPRVQYVVARKPA